ncbi:hypothetical protein NQZ68_007220, partial [Dissostichus eleginoides]
QCQDNTRKALKDSKSEELLENKKQQETNSSPDLVKRLDALEEMIIKQTEKQQNYTRELIAQLIYQDIPVSPPKEGDIDCN